MKVPAYGSEYSGPAPSSPTSVTVHALKENKRPIGFAAEWPEEKPKPKRKPATRRKTT